MPGKQETEMNENQLLESAKEIIIRSVKSAGSSGHTSPERAVLNTWTQWGYDRQYDWQALDRIVGQAMEELKADGKIEYIKGEVAMPKGMKGKSFQSVILK
jgi:hypothetical protein